MKSCILLLLVLLAVLSPDRAQAQTFDVPRNYRLVTLDDYRKHAKDVIAAAHWLESKPVNSEPDKRQQVEQFVQEYLQGSPEVAVEVPAYLQELTANNPELPGLFIASWARHQLQNPTITDPHSLNMAALKAVLKYYRQGYARKDKNLDKLVELEKKDKLRSWLVDKLK